MNVRTLATEDAVIYRNLRLQALVTNPEAFVTTYEDYRTRSIQQVGAQLAPDDHHFTLGAFDDSDKLVGTVTIVREQARKLRHIANVVAMYVSPDARRQGVGRELLSALIFRTKCINGLAQLRLSVVEANFAAVGLYRSMGFQVYGVEQNAIKTAQQSWNEIHMVFPLSDEHHRDVRFVDQFNGFSHVTIDVSNLDTSLRFYVDILGLSLAHRGRKDCYLKWGTAWICLQERPELPQQQRQLGVNHIALYVAAEAFTPLVNILHNANVKIVRGPVERGGGWTVNFLDPDGTQLEFHTGTLEERMKVWE